jgi:hypothetical protein
MSRRQVVEIQCSRCERVEHLEDQPTPNTGAPPPPPALLAQLSLGAEGKNVTVRFEDLCTPCHRSVRALLEQVGKRIEGVSPDRVAKAKPAEAKKEGQAPNGPAPRAGQPAASKNPAATRSS